MGPAQHQLSNTSSRSSNKNKESKTRKQSHSASTLSRSRKSLLGKAQQKSIDSQLPQQQTTFTMVVSDLFCNLLKSATNAVPRIETIPYSKLELKNDKDETTCNEEIEEVRHPTSYIETLIHVLKGNVGSGMFSMGEAFKNGGLLLSPVLTIILGMICIYNNHVLLRAADYARDKFCLGRNPNFAETVELCFRAGPDKFKWYSDFIRLIVKTFVIITQLGFCCVYICVVSETLKELMPSPFEHEMTVRQCMVLILPPVLATSLITSLKFLVPVSLLSNLCVFSAVSLTLFVAIRDNNASVSDRAAVGPLNAIPLFMGKVIYSFEGIGLVLPLRNEMKEPKQFGGTFGVLNVGMSVVCTFLVVVGFIGYLSYGDNVKSSLSLNIPETDSIGIAVQIIMCLGLLFSYPLQFYVPADIIWDDINRIYGPFIQWNRGKLSTRTIIVLMTFVVAALIPDVGLFISLIGSLCATSLALLFPALLAVIMSMEKPAGSVTICLTIITIFLAIFSFITGTYISVTQMLHTLEPSELCDIDTLLKPYFK